MVFHLFTFLIINKNENDNKFILGYNLYEYEDDVSIYRYPVMHKCNVDIDMVVHQYDNAYDVLIWTILLMHNRIQYSDEAFHVYDDNEYGVPIHPKW